MKRNDGRKFDELRSLSFHKAVVHPSQLSVQVRWGDTIVQCGVNIENSVPRFLKGSGKGWLTSEYSMLPLSSDERVPRDRQKMSGRTVEIQRLIGRSLRSMVNLSVLGERTIMVDCDVLSADGGTRTACITGASLATQVLLRRMIKENLVSNNVLRFELAAVSLGVFNGEVLLDLDYHEDFKADVDANLIMNNREQLVEFQGCAEGSPYSLSQLQEMTAVGMKGINEILEKQREYLATESLS
jgi:ribonuclease PH